MAIPIVHLVSHATDLGIARARAAELSTVLFAAAFVSRILFGMVADHMAAYSREIKKAFVDRVFLYRRDDTPISRATPSRLPLRASETVLTETSMPRNSAASVGGFHDCSGRDHQWSLQSRGHSPVRAWCSFGLTLSSGFSTLFERQPAREKRRLLNFLLSNCTWEDGEVVAIFRQPFDLLAETNTAVARLNAGNGGNSLKNEIRLDVALILGRTHGAVRRRATIVRRQLGLLT